VEKAMVTHKATFKALPIDWLVRGQFQPRAYFDVDALKELATSIKAQGILQPIVVRPIDNQQYEIIAGERRWRAAQQAGLEQVPCLIRLITDEEALQIALVENTARQNLNPLEEAEGILKLVNLFGYTHEEIATVMGKSRSDVSNLVRLIKLDQRVKTLILEGKLTKSHAKLLADVPIMVQYELAKQTVVKNWSIRVLEKAIKQLEKDQHSITKTSISLSSDVKRLEQQLSDYFGASINLKIDKKNIGHLKIKFNSLDELEGIFNKIGFKYE